jgi:hypothetical protein
LKKIEEKLFFLEETKIKRFIRFEAETFLLFLKTKEGVERGRSERKGKSEWEGLVSASLTQIYPKTGPKHNPLSDQHNLIIV